jgi:hypothetical protein
LESEGARIAKSPGLAPVDLTAYAQQIRKVFQIEALTPIEFEAIEPLTPEIERRRTLLRHFIPDIFTPGKYDRRADIIDGCIYYLEFLAGEGNQALVLTLWSKRAQFVYGRKRFRAQDIEEGPYGYETYHPLWNVIGNPSNPIIIPKLVQYIYCFKDRKMKLDINDYSLIFFNLFNTMPYLNVNSKMRNVVQLLQEEISRPLLDGIELKTFLEQKGFGGTAAKLTGWFSKGGFKLTNVYERSTFELSRFLLDFPFPHHYKISYKGVTLTQNFLTGGRDYFQEVTLNLPTDVDWKALMQKVHPETQIYRATLYRNPHPPFFFKFFDVYSQDWITPWDEAVQEWNALLEEKRDQSPLEPDYGLIIPNEEILKLTAVLEETPLILNSELNIQTKIPLEKVKSLRKILEEEVLAYRTIVFLHPKLFSLLTIDLPGIETWKYRILTKIGELFPGYYIFHMENLKTSEESLRSIVIHTPEQTNTFIRRFQETFQGVFKYKIHQMFHKWRFFQPFKESFDPKTGTWKFNPKDYIFTPLLKPKKG